MGTVEAERLMAEVKAAREEMDAMRQREKEMEERVINAEEGQKVAAAAFTKTRRDMEMFQARNAALEKEVEDLKAVDLAGEVEKLKADLEQSRQEKEKFRSELELASAEKDRLGDIERAMQAKIAGKQAELDLLKQENTALVRLVWFVQAGHRIIREIMCIEWELHTTVCKKHVLCIATSYV